MSNSLYELSAGLARINEVIIEAEGVVSVEMEAELDQLLPAIQDKAGNIGRWCRNLDGSMLALDAEIKRLKHKKEMAENLQGRLKLYLKESMERAGMTKIDAGVVTLSIQKNPLSVDIPDESFIPAAYKDVIPEQYVISKRRILEALKEGKEVTGATLVDNKTHLRLR